MTKRESNAVLLARIDERMGEFCRSQDEMKEHIKEVKNQVMKINGQVAKVTIHTAENKVKIGANKQFLWAISGGIVLMAVAGYLKVFVGV